MKPVRGAINPELLHDYVDGHLGDEARLEIARHIDENPEAAEMVRAYRAQNAALLREYGNIIEEPVPQRLLDVIEVLRRNPARWR